MSWKRAEQRGTTSTTTTNMFGQSGVGTPEPPDAGSRTSTWDVLNVNEGWGGNTGTSGWDAATGHAAPTNAIPTNVPTHCPAECQAPNVQSGAGHAGGQALICFVKQSQSLLMERAA